MKVDINTVVSLQYKLTNHKTGQHIEETSADRPMQFLYGVERLIPTFEEAIFGLEAGQTAAFAIEAAQAYGMRNEEQVVMIPINVFHDETGKINTEHIFEGAILPMTDQEGNHLQGIVMAIDTEAVKMDFNHPLAGTDLHFDVTISNVREASADEIAHGHTHGEHGHHH